MQINLSDSDIAGTTSSSHGFHSKHSADMDSLMSYLTSGKPSHGTTSKNMVDGHASVNGNKKTDFFGGKK